MPAPASAPPAPPTAATKPGVDTTTPAPVTPEQAARPAPPPPAARPVPPAARALLAGGVGEADATGVCDNGDDGAHAAEPLLDPSEDRFTLYPIK